MIADPWHDVIAPLLGVIATWITTTVLLAAAAAWWLRHDHENRTTPTDPEERP